ncbi:basic proline-rich protein-like [Tachyglossus aculeatus]|uniref:basic proline-rich protein-like n=1 Tax=Tachyglossus aculeatus TaxID=9261 RepID=UPI0018F6AEE0|nr:basic proline-rich protein-like [Tachyglossus aculeatus]
MAGARGPKAGPCSAPSRSGRGAPRCSAPPVARRPLVVIQWSPLAVGQRRPPRCSAPPGGQAAALPCWRGRASSTQPSCPRSRSASSASVPGTPNQRPLAVRQRRPPRCSAPPGGHAAASPGGQAAAPPPPLLGAPWRPGGGSPRWRGRASSTQPSCPRSRSASSASVPGTPKRRPLAVRQRRPPVARRPLVVIQWNPLSVRQRRPPPLSQLRLGPWHAQSAPPSGQAEAPPPPLLGAPRCSAPPGGHTVEPPLGQAAAPPGGHAVTPPGGQAAALPCRRGRASSTQPTCPRSRSASSASVPGTPKQRPLAVRQRRPPPVARRPLVVIHDAPWRSGSGAPPVGRRPLAAGRRLSPVGGAGRCCPLAAPAALAVPGVQYVALVPPRPLSQLRRGPARSLRRHGGRRRRLSGFVGPRSVEGAGRGGRGARRASPGGLAGEVGVGPVGLSVEPAFHTARGAPPARTPPPPAVTVGTRTPPPAVTTVGTRTPPPAVTTVGARTPPPAVTVAARTPATVGARTTAVRTRTRPRHAPTPVLAAQYPPPPVRGAVWGAPPPRPAPPPLAGSPPSAASVSLASRAAS